MAYQLRILKAASRELEQLDKTTGRRITERLNWLAKNLETIRPETLSGNLSGLYKLRVGTYRVIYEILPDEQIIVIHALGHRKEIYRKR